MKRFLTRVGYALQGWAAFFSNEKHGQIQAVVALVVISAGFFFGITTPEWVQLLLCIAMVLVAEMANTAIEKLADHLHPEQHPNIGRVKDIAAGAVLFAAVISCIIGLLIFWTYLKNLFQ
jgi:diacylglycerol kinase